MTTPTSVEEIGAALDANDGAPYGPARTLRAEQLADLAEPTGNRPLLIRALQSLIDAREFSGKSGEALVPFARVLRMWDDDPADFDRWAAHRLHWHFKWVSSSVLTNPDIALSSIDKWREQMADRYRQAGYGMHAVYARQHYVAAHLGDEDAARRWFDDWVTAERDAMSDCHACDRNGQGEWLAHLGRDAEALQTWGPALRGELRCTEEPHRILAKSLVPLVRLGRLAQARDNHLRGYRMVRGNPNLRRAVGEHLEFAALTGNEARGLELLAEHAGWLAPDGIDAATRASFLEGVAILLRRLDERGYGDAPVRAGTGTTPVRQLLPVVLAEIGDIARRFDARNGTAAYGERSRARLARGPLVDSLPLGVRAAVPPTPSAPRPRPPAPVPVSVDDLIAEARRLDEARHPHARTAWERVARSGAPLAPEVAAQIAQCRALAVRGTAVAGARTLFLEAAELFDAAGRPGRAIANRARAGLAAVLGGDAGTGWAELDAAGAAIGALDDRDAVLVRLCRARGAWYRWVSSGTPDTGSPDYAAVREEVRAAAEVVARAGEAYQHAGLDVLRGQIAWAAGDPDGAGAHFTRAVQGYLAAQAPWEAATPRALLAELALGRGDAPAADEYARVAVAETTGLLDASMRANLARLRAYACWHLGDRDAETVDHALTAAHHFDEDAPDQAAQARLLAGQAFHRMRRYAEAAALLETVLPELEPGYDLVNARRLTGNCLVELGEYLAGARHLLAAAAIAQDWPDQTAHASLAHDAAFALNKGGALDEADRAFARAAQLWRALGELGSAIRATRARAWILARRPEPDWPGGLALLAAAQAELTAAAPTEPAQRWEIPETQRQSAQLIVSWSDTGGAPEETLRDGLRLAGEAARGFAALGDFRAAVRTGLVAAELDVALDRRAEATERVRSLRATCLERGEPELVERCDRYLDWLVG